MGLPYTPTSSTYFIPGFASVYCSIAFPYQCDTIRMNVQERCADRIETLFTSSLALPAQLIESCCCMSYLSAEDEHVRSAGVTAGESCAVGSEL